MNTRSKIFNSNQYLRVALLCIAAACLFMFFMTPDLAQAQAGDPITLQSLRNAAATTPEDESLRFFKGVLGESFVDNPLSAAGGASTLLGSMVFIFNSIIFVIGSGWAGFTVVSLITESAHDGGLSLGKTDSAWLPLRSIVGIVGMVPALGGFSIFQGVMMLAVTLGIGAANMLTGALIDRAAEMQAITPAYSSAASAPNLSSELKNATRGLFLSELCLAGVNDFNSMGNGPIEVPLPINSTVENGYDYGKCGYVTVHHRAGSGTDARSNSGLQSITSFRIKSVNYDSIEQAVHNAAVVQLQLIRAQAAQAAGILFSQLNDGQSNSADSVDQSEAKLNKIETTARANLNGAIQSATNNQTSGIEETVLQSMRQGGWSQVGLYYATFAETSAALADAQHAWSIDYRPGYMIDSLASGISKGAPVGKILSEYLSIQKQNQTQSPRGFFDGAVGVFTDKNATGETSIGQNLVNLMTGAVAENSGGYGLVDPIIASKNLGDYLMLAGQAGIGAKVVAAKNPIAIGLKQALPEAGELYTVVCYLFIGLGTFLSIYIPMSLFLTWFSALVSYFASVLKAILYAQIGALNHLHKNGEGFVSGNGARAYLYILNMILRPSLMVLGFVLAAATMTFGGSLFLHFFPIAMSNAQGNSLTGALSICALMVLFCVAFVTLIQTCNNLINVGDELLGYFGINAETSNGAILGAAAGSSMRSNKGLSAGSGGGSEVPKLPTPAGATGSAAATVLK